MTRSWNFPPLRPGDVVRVVSPSLPSMAFATARRVRAERALNDLGLEVDYSEGCFEISDDGLSAGSAEQRAFDIMAAFSDPSVAAILCAVGGITSGDVVEHLDAEIIRSHPKPFIGRSDNLAICAYLHRHCGLASVAGATFLSQFGDDVVMTETLHSFKHLLMSSESIQYTVAPTRTVDGREWREMITPSGQVSDSLVRSRIAQSAFLRPGRAKGTLLGAEIKQLPALLKADLLDLEGALLWWDTGEADVKYVEEYLRETAGIADLTQVAGMLVGDNPWIPWTDWLEAVTHLLDKYVGDAEYPVYIGGDCGHYDPAWLLPYGAEVQLDSRVGLIFARM